MYPHFLHLRPERTDSVEDQLDDLTELLKSALGESESTSQPTNYYNGNQSDVVSECVVNTRNPGKIDRSFIENIERETLTLARKVG